MRESKITYEQVSAIAQKLQDQGEKPMARTILAIIGGGSMGTILKYLQQWQNDKNTPSKHNNNTLNPTIVSAINTTMASQIQQETSALTAELSDLQAELESLIIENEKSENIIASRNAELDEMKSVYSTLTGRFQQVNQETIRVTADLTAERQSLQTINIALAKAEFSLEAVPKIELENQNLRAENESMKTKVAEIHQSEAVALTKLEQAQQIALEARESSAKANNTLEALRQKYEQLQGSAIEKERTSAKLLENERLTSQSLQSKFESVTHELKLAHLSAEEARSAADKALQEIRKNSEHIIYTKDRTNDDIFNFEKNEPSELDKLDVF